MANRERRQDTLGPAAEGQEQVHVLFLLDGQQYSLRLAEVQRILRAVEVSEVPDSPAHLMGVINVQGDVLPVVDLRVRLGLRQREVRPEDHFIVTRVGLKSFVLPVDAAIGSAELPTLLADEEAARPFDCVSRVIPGENGLVFSLDVECLLAEGDADYEQLEATAVPAGEVA